MLFGIYIFVQPTEFKRLKLIEALRRGPSVEDIGGVTKRSPTPKQKVLVFWIGDKGAFLSILLVCMREYSNFGKVCNKLFICQSILLV